MRRLIFYVIGSLCLFLAGMAAGVFLDRPPSPQAKTTDLIGELHKNGKLTSPLLECSIPITVGKTEFNTFEANLRSQIESFKSAGKVTHVSIYFRHLLDGAWIGIDETENFTPASLLKVPNMMALYKDAETDPSILTKQMGYTKKYVEGASPHYLPQQNLELNKSYTVDDLITRMIKYSDNESMYLLRTNFDPPIFNSLYTDLGIATPDDTVSDDFMNVKTYASFFRILYNASYLSVPMSEKALALLTQITFDKGLVAGVPKDTTVAHKFGERVYTDDNSKQLHDCGIVYHPHEPYLLCVMTRGKDFDTLADVIKNISASVWKEVDARSNSPSVSQ